MTGSMKKVGGTAAAIALAAAVVGGGASAATETSPPIAPDPGPSIKTTFVTPRAPTPDKVARLSTPAVWPNGGLTPVVRSAPAGADVQVSGSVVRVRGKGGRLQLDYSRFRDAYGGDWAARLRLVRLGEKGREQVPGRNDLEAGTVTAQVAAGEAYTLDAGPSGSTGDYKATSLAPSDSWQVSRQTGDFTWSEPIGDAPPVPGDFAPEFALTYASGSVDGRVASTNNQTSWVGEGWNLSTGFIERRYIGCAYDLAPGQLKTGDLCWKTDNATLSLGGRSSQLVKIPDTNKWRPVDDDGSRIERLTDAPNDALGGEHWRVTTPDGTQHYFGRRADSGATWTVPVFGNHQDEPCHQATFATSHCRQAWRWNLDYSVDTNGNSISYYYARETNSYGLNMGSATATYTRGGVLTRAEYGARNGVGPTARIVFETADRCMTGTTCARTEMPDVPWDQNCDTATCPGRVSPTFWSTKRLAKVTTQVGSGTTWTAVDEWTLAQSFPKTGDGTAPALWLDSVTHTGRTGAGGATEGTPPVEFVPAPYNNRADTATDGLPPMPKFRISTVRTPAGGEITVVYDRDCDPTALPQPYANSTRCFPVRWTPEGASARDDWFAKYVVARVTEKDLVAEGTTMVTNYEYLGGAGWRYNDDELVAPEHRTWSRYRGYEKVLVTRGDHTDPQVSRSATQYQYFRGLDGDHLPTGTRRSSVTDSRGGSVVDSDQLAGFLREERTFNGVGGPEVSSTIADPYQLQTAGGDGPLRSYHVDIAASRTRTAVPGGERKTLTEYTYNDDGLVKAVNDLGDESTTDDDQCERTEYARDEAAWRLDLPSRQTTVAAACSATPVLPRDAISEERTYYDGRALGEPPTTNTAVRVEELDSFNDTTPRYVTTERTTLDAYGREVASEDALGRRTTTSFSPATGRPTSSTKTNPKGHRATRTFSALRGQPTTVLDVDNNRPTDLRYDALGRLTDVWLPGRSRGFAANTRYRYRVRKDGTSWVSTESLTPDGSYTTSYSLLDGFLRERQTQSPGSGGGVVFTSTEYDSRGLAFKVTGPEHKEGDPSGDFLKWADTSAYRQTVTTYDGAERPTVMSYRSRGDEQWTTEVQQHGDGTSVIPPRGGTPERVVTDARGRIVRRLQYHGATPDGDHDTTEYGYDDAGRLTSVTDPMGNRWRNEYDLRGRRTKVEDPDSGTSTFTYDDAGQLQTSTDGRGKRLAYQYDALGRKSAMYADSVSGTKLAGWTYDTLPGGVGLPTASTRYVGSAAYTARVTEYGLATGRPASSEVVIPAAEKGLAGIYKTTYSYRPDGSLGGETLPKLGTLDPESLQYSYDTLGLPLGLKGLAEYVSKTQYSWFGDRTQLTMGPVGREAWHTQFYDPATGRLERAFTQRQTAESTVDDTTYGYDPAGNVTRISDRYTGAPAEDQCFRYDYGQRLTEAWTSTVGCDGEAGSSLGGPTPYWSSWRYDVAGNRRSQIAHAAGGDTTSTYAYPEPGAPRPHAVKSVQTAGPAGARTDTYTYDDAGNTTATRGQELTWDDEQNLASMGSSRFVYDADGNRLIRRDAGGSTLYLASGEVRAPADGTPATGTRYYVHGGETVALRDAGGLRYLISDHHGTDEMRIDASTLAVTKRRSDPFGNPRGAQPSWPGSHGFVGGIQDPTGLTHLGAREYDPAIGRFISVDPIIDVNDPQQVNGYAYANSSPVTLSDPDGLIAVRCPDGECPGGGYKPNQSPASRFNARPKANTWRPLVGPVQGERPLCNGLGRCVPKRTFTDVCNKWLSPGACGCDFCRAANAVRHQADKRRAAEAEAAAARAAEEARKPKERIYSGKLQPVTAGWCAGVEVGIGIFVIGASRCHLHDIRDPSRTITTHSVKAGVGPRSPVLVTQLVAGGVVSETPLEGSGSNWGWWLDLSAYYSNTSIGRSFAGDFGPRYLAAGNHRGGGPAPSFASGVRFSW